MSAYKKSVGDTSDQGVARIFLCEYPLAWESTLDALKAYPMETVNRENGSLLTQWVDYTQERNRFDSAGLVNVYVKARQRYRVYLSKGFFEGQASVRVLVNREEQAQRDLLSGMKPLESDGIQENAILYRIGKLIEFKSRLQKIESERLQEQIDTTAP